jgi:Ca2+-binding EF-hand superfamily protein
MQAVEIADAVGAAGDSAVEEEAAAVAAEASANPPKAEGAAKLLWLQPGEDDIKELFAGYDVNGDGTITHAEVVQVLSKVLGDNVDAEQLNEAAKLSIAEFDLDGDGKVTLAEANSVWEASKTQKLKAVFAEYDVNGDGSIGKEEFLKVMTNLLGTEDQEMLGELAGAIMEGSDANNDGKVTFDEFVGAVNKGVIRLVDA